MIESIREEPKKGPLHLVVYPPSTRTTKASRGHNQSTRIRKVGLGVFEFRTSMSGNGLSYFGDRCIILRKTREIAQSRSVSARSGLGNVYTLVTYRFANSDAKVRKKVQRLIRSSLCVRLRPGALLFPYLRARDGRRLITSAEKERLHLSGSLSRRLSSLDAEIHRWGRLEPRGEKDRVLIGKAVAKAISAELSSIHSKIVSLQSIIQSHDTMSRRLWDRHGELNKEYKHLKLRLKVLERIWHLDMNRPLMRIYNALLKARRELVNRETQLMIRGDRSVSIGPI
ncbi:MAG: hypothetical protein JSW61_09180 [Candidatus Thorarchaeota archaeon]|nr:MAG: hypothetical protein JSW61_09180 [Candidatus Thorarchaeota archaeon]